ncbi:hypothetical protein [Pseudarthrobacter sp. S9]|uniref:hypothetical protein n=1 Tax=Pseudarthrobacter sp. S9 TaxID=3418421 RepID=UPI003CFE9AE4
MNRPDPNSPDPGANQDDAVWLDLVARLEGVSGPDEDTQPEVKNPEVKNQEVKNQEVKNPEGKKPDGPGDGAAPARTFKDFDPLGLSVTAPIELSAKERLASAAGTPATAGGEDGPDTTPGPRDYEPDDDGGFVPEEPPSLAGADPMTVLAWIGAVGGPIALVLSAMFWRSAPLVAILGMVAAFAASVVFLIMKLPGEKDEHDDGARV